MMNDANGGGDGGDGIDAIPPDAPAVGIATIRVSVNGEPLPNLTIVWNSPDGAVQTVEQTDANGVASEMIERGASVGAINGGTWWLYLGIEPEDDLELDPGGTVNTIAGSLNVTLPALPAGATNWGMQVGGADCGLFGGTTATTVPVTVLSRCTRSDGNIDILAIAVGSATSSVLEFTTVSAAPSGDVTMPAWSTTLPPLAVNVHDLSPGITGVIMLDGVHSSGREFYFASRRASGSGTISIPHVYPGAFGESLTYQANLENANGIGATIYGAVPTKPATLAIDGRWQPPELTTPTLTSANDRVDVAYTRNVVASAGDAVYMRLKWSSRQGFTSLVNVLAPPTLTSFTLPELPVELHDRLLPDATAPNFEVNQMYGLDASWAADYRMARKAIGMRLAFDLPNEVLPETGGILGVSRP